MEDKDRLPLLKDEYLFLQQQYEDYDRRSLTIKGWVGSGSVAALALAFNAKHPAAALIPLFTIVLAVVIWMLEANWKLFQHSFAYRIRTLEAHFRGDTTLVEAGPPAPFQIYSSWFRALTEDPPVYKYEEDGKLRRRSRRARFLAAATLPFVYALYVTIIVLSLISMVVLIVWPPG